MQTNDNTSVAIAPDPKWPYAIAWIILSAVIVGVCVFAFFEHRARRVAINQPPLMGTVPPFELMNEKGTTITLASMRGKPWVTDFIFSYCAGQCPMMSSKMFALQQWLGQKDYDTRLVSFSVDPDRDTTTVLAEYGKRFKADPKRWDFVTGNRKGVYSLARRGFKLGVEDNPSTAPDDEIFIHSNRLVLVDADGEIRGYYDSSDDDSMKKLRLDISALEARRRSQ
jgi:protein SCO1/2